MKYIIFKIIVFLIILLFFERVSCQVAVNEIMPSPQGDEPEWIELFNFSDSDFQMMECTIFDAVGSKLLPLFTIRSKSYAILTSDSSSLIAARTIPPECLIIETSLPILNNTTDEIKIVKQGMIIDSVYYNMSWGEKGKSLERKDYMKSAVSKDNWGVSKNPSGATAGYFNSISVLDYDLALSEFYFDRNQQNYIFVITNKGRYSLADVEFLLIVDENRDGLFTNKEEVFRKSIDIADKDTLFADINYNILFPQKNKFGAYSFIARIINKNDQNPMNDSLFGEVYNSYPNLSLTINEIMFDVDVGKAEFIEIYNNSEDAILLKNYGISDRWKSKGPDIVKFTDNSFILPQSYALIAWDSVFFEQYPELINNASVSIFKSSFNLNKSDDDVILFDPNGFVCDSLTYKESWHLKNIVTRNISLEKINPKLETNSPESWSSCNDTRGATPMEKNSISSEFSETGTVDAKPNPFSPTSRGNDSFCVINYSLPFRQSSISAYVFDTSGRRIRKLKVSEPTSANGFFVWDGRNDDGYILQAGPYVLFLEAADHSSGKVITQKLMIVIGS